MTKQDKIDEMYEAVIEMRTYMKVIAERGCSAGHEMNEKTQKEVEEKIKELSWYVKGVGILGMSIGSLMTLLLSKWGGIGK